MFFLLIIKKMRIAAEIYFILKMIELLFSKKEYEAEKSVRDFLPHIYSSGREKNSKLSKFIAIKRAGGIPA